MKSFSTFEIRNRPQGSDAAKLLGSFFIAYLFLTIPTFGVRANVNGSLHCLAEGYVNGKHNTVFTVVQKRNIPQKPMSKFSQASAQVALEELRMFFPKDEHRQAVFSALRCTVTNPIFFKDYSNIERDNLFLFYRLVLNLHV